TTLCAAGWCSRWASAPEPAPDAPQRRRRRFHRSIPFPARRVPMDLNLSGKRALVCGGSEGIGRAAAHELALLGADVTLLARRESALREVAEALPRPQPGQRHGWLAVDVAQSEALEAQVRALAETGPVHIL